jgi:3-hydroxyacyl-[acyl-carrier-protein] dehydratase
VKVKMDSTLIKKMLPHRYPFLLLDKVIELDPGKSAVGIKNVTINEPYFCGHFPTESLVPGVLIVESLAQLTAVMYGTGQFPEDTDWGNLDGVSIDAEKIAANVGYLVEIKNVKFKNIVRPGDVMVLRVFIKSSFQNLSVVKIDASVEGNIVMEGTIGVTQRS